MIKNLNFKDYIKPNDFNFIEQIIKEQLTDKTFGVEVDLRDEKRYLYSS